MEGNNTGRNLSEAGRAFMCVYVHKLLHDFGRLESYMPVEPEYIDSDMSYEAVWNGLWNVSEAVWNHYSEEYQVETMYFSHPDVMEYYRLCRVYSKEFGVKLANNPYMRSAESYVRSQLEQGCYSCEYRLQTKINHEWASGIVFRMWPEFEWHFELLQLLLGIFDFYSEQLEKLKKELEAAKNNQMKEAA